MIVLPKDLKIGVLRGGPSPEYEVSLQSGSYVLEKLKETHQPLDIFISKEGLWHMNGFERTPDKILKNVDVVFNAMHGVYGEDGQIQDLLSYYGVPYTGSSKFASAISMNKSMTKDLVNKLGIKTPTYIVIKREDDIKNKAYEAFSNIPHPLVVKPVSSGSSHGLYLVQSLPELLSTLEAIFSVYSSALVEEYISGKEITCTVIQDFRDQKEYVTPPVEVLYQKDTPVWTYGLRYAPDTSIIYPTTLFNVESRIVEEASRLVHRNMALSHFSRSDFIVSPKRGVYFLEVNTVPGLTKKSLLPKSLESIGLSFKEFIHHVLSLALSKK
ncbi:MAG: D-alanine--D-alanine ligase [Candidatus Paceibacterota bacterium]